MWVGGQCHPISAVLHPGNGSCTHRTGGWVGPTPRKLILFPSYRRLGGPHTQETDPVPIVQETGWTPHPGNWSCIHRTGGWVDPTPRKLILYPSYRRLGGPHTQETDPLPIVQEAGWTPHPGNWSCTHRTGGWVDPTVGLDVCGKSRHTRIRSPDLQALSESLYRWVIAVHNTALGLEIIDAYVWNLNHSIMLKTDSAHFRILLTTLFLFSVFLFELRHSKSKNNWL
jgi:hypothetical protein